MPSLFVLEVTTVDSPRLRSPSVDDITLPLVGSVHVPVTLELLVIIEILHQMRFKVVKEFSEWRPSNKFNTTWN
jgi:hypothetical protein